MKSTILLLLLSASCFICSASPELFTHYRLQRGKRVADRHLAAPQLGEVYTISSRFSDPPIDCGVACNLNLACTAFSLNSSNSCALFNDQVSLIHLENQADSTVYANHKMSTCIKDFYPDLVAMNCFPKKVADAACSASIECSDLKGLECADVNQDGQGETCRCRNPDSNYWDATAVKCLPKLTNGQPCQSVDQCLPSKGLDCLDTNGDAKIVALALTQLISTGMPPSTDATAVILLPSIGTTHQPNVALLRSSTASLVRPL
jgi:hypothetical protein